MPSLRFPAVALAPGVFMLASIAGTAGDAWPGFRGDGTSHYTGEPLPEEWTDESVAWAVDLPGSGQSQPVVWDERVFVTSVAGGLKESLVVTAIGLADGAIAWQRELPNARPQRATDMVSLAAPTPAVDADGLYVFFETGDIYSLARNDGETRWHRSLTDEFGPFSGNHGIGSSLAQSPDSLVLLIDHDGPSYLMRIAKQSGETLWRRERDARVSWSSPTVDGDSILISSNGVAEELALEDGSVRWRTEGIKMNTVASPTVTADLVLIGSSNPGSTVAIHRDGSGETAWSAGSVTSSFGSPLVAGNAAFFVSKAGVAHCSDLATGGLLWECRLPDSCWASPVFERASNRIFFPCKDGTTVVMAASPVEPKVLSESSVTISPNGKRLYAAAAAGGRLLLRTGDRLVCVGDSSH